MGGRATLSVSDVSFRLKSVTTHIRLVQLKMVNERLEVLQRIVFRDHGVLCAHEVGGINHHWACGGDELRAKQGAAAQNAHICISRRILETDHRMRTVGVGAGRVPTAHSIMSVVHV